MKNETPSALISGAIRGALRSGRYANRSMTTPSTPQPSIATRTINAIRSQTGTTDRARRRASRARPSR